MENQQENFTEPSVCHEASGGARRIGRVIRKMRERETVLRLFRGICLLIFAFLLGRCELFLGARPFGLALLAAAEGGLPFVFGGVILSALPVFGGIFRPIAIVAATAAVLLRVAVRMTVDLPWERDAEPSVRSLGVFLSALFREHFALRMTTAAVSVFLVGLYAMVSGGFRVYDLLGALLGLLLAPLATLLFALAARDRVFSLDGARKTVLAALVLAVFVLALSGVAIYRVELAVALALGATLWVTNRRGIAAGILVGLLLGLAVDPVSAPLYAFGAIGAGALRRISTFMGALSALSVGMAWGFYVYGLSALSGLLPGLLAAALLHCVLERLGFLPGSPRTSEVCEGCETLPEREGEAEGEDSTECLAPREDLVRVLRSALAEERLRDEERRIEDLCGAFLSISELLGALRENGRYPGCEELRRVCDRVCDEFCPGCVSCAICWGREYARMAAVLGQMAEALRDNGTVDESVFPPEVRERCGMSGAILYRIKEEVGRLIAETQKREKAGILSADYGAAAALFRSASQKSPGEYTVDEGKSYAAEALLRGFGVTPTAVAVSGGRRGCLYLWGVDRRAFEGVLLSEERRNRLSEVLGFSLGEAEFTPIPNGGGLCDLRLPSMRVYRVRSAFASRSARRGGRAEGLCGDSVALFESGDGRSFALLSDGMGSGRSAAHLSGICTVFLRQMLSGGGDTGVILRMLNDFLSAGAEGESSATVDLLDLDLYSGEASFWKSGAAPSFVLREGNVFKLTSRTAPAGILPEADVQRTVFRLYPGDVVVMISDGVADGGEEAELLETMLGEIGTDEELGRAAERIADGMPSAEDGEESDDRSVILVAVEAEEEVRLRDLRAG